MVYHAALGRNVRQYETQKAAHQGLQNDKLVRNVRYSISEGMLPDKELESETKRCEVY